MDLFNTEFLDICIEGARSKKKTVDSKMNLIMSLMREVEWREKAAKKAKQEVDNCTLDINLEMDELIMAQQQVKESNDKRAKEVYAQRVELATEMKELQSCVSGVLNEGDGCVATIDEMCKALEKRLISAIIKKEAADKDKLGKELALAYQKSQMEKLVTESKRLEQEAMENLKLQKFLIDRGHVLNMLQDDISCRCQDVKILKAELEDYKDVTEDYLRPIIQEIPPMHDCEGYKCCNILKGANGRTAAASREEMGTTKTVKCRINDMDQLDKGKQVRIGPNLKHVYQANQMEKLVEESKILDQQAIENFKVVIQQ
ncbi:hypothetical protein HanRHA438_Chr04g0188091 [Helianthus annuus]|nr:hypothetical protein HanRHA438_Chr04g0188091 [Helianthus annuus]